MLGRRGARMREPALPIAKSEWRGFKIDKGHLKRFTDACRQAPSDTMPMTFPLVFAFPLHMSMVCHGQFPLSYVRMMQVSNHIIQHCPIHVQETMDVSCEIVGQRVVRKGLEMDVYTVLEIVGQPVWESIHTYFFPGDVGEPGQFSPSSDLPPLSDNVLNKTWKMPNGGGFCFGLMAGDYNPIHYFAPYGRLMGFRRDFAHSQITIALCLKHLPAFPENQPVCLDVSIKGPVYYGSNVTMKLCDAGNSHSFELYCEDNPRPCIKGALSSPESDFDSMYDSFLVLRGVSAPNNG